MWLVGVIKLKSILFDKIQMSMGWFFQKYNFLFCVQMWGYGKQSELVNVPARALSPYAYILNVRINV